MASSTIALVHDRVKKSFSVLHQELTTRYQTKPIVDPQEVLDLMFPRFKIAFILADLRDFRPIDTLRLLDRLQKAYKTRQSFKCYVLLLAPPLIGYTPTAVAGIIQSRDSPRDRFSHIQKQFYENVNKDKFLESVSASAKLAGIPCPGTSPLVDNPLLMPCNDLKDMAQILHETVEIASTTSTPEAKAQKEEQKQLRNRLLLSVFSNPQIFGLSMLQKLPGLRAPVEADFLLQAFGSVQGVATATAAEILDATPLDPNAARAIAEFFQADPPQWNDLGAPRMDEFDE